MNLFWNSWKKFVFLFVSEPGAPLPVRKRRRIVSAETARVRREMAEAADARAASPPYKPITSPITPVMAAQHLDQLVFNSKFKANIDVQ